MYQGGMLATSPMKSRPGSLFLPEIHVLQERYPLGTQTFRAVVRSQNKFFG